MQAYIKGEKSLEEVIQDFDRAQSLLTDNSSAAYTTVTKTINNDECAKLVGIAFAQASGADMALISKNKWYKDGGNLNTEGVSGELYALPLTDIEITSILPTGWKKNIQTVTLTGKRVKELAEQGYDRSGFVYPYELVTKEGFEIEDDTTYTVAICGVSEEVAKEGNVTDTGILGLTAAEEYVSQFDTLSADDIIWK